jgi:hypothetical protein
MAGKVVWVDQLAMSLDSFQVEHGELNICRRSRNTTIADDGVDVVTMSDE